VDVGGTFTDLVALSEESGLTTAKVPSIPRDQSEGVLNAVGASGVARGAVAALAHGDATPSRRGGFRYR
jgi:N-methylhydantoinase A